MRVLNLLIFVETEPSFAYMFINLRSLVFLPLPIISG